MITDLAPVATVGTVSILNVGEGDITLTFDPGNAKDVTEGMRQLLEMQQRGYLIAVQLPDGTFTRCDEIDPTSGSYIITLPADSDAPPGATPAPPKKRGRGRPRMKVPVDQAHAVAVARSAGG